MNWIEIEKELCKECQYCVFYCPKSLIKIQDNLNSYGFRYAVFSDEKQQCKGCKICALMCPDAAINVYGEVKQYG